MTPKKKLIFNIITRVLDLLVCVSLNIALLYSTHKWMIATGLICAFIGLGAYTFLIYADVLEYQEAIDDD